ncbi:MAG: flippase-like domain-containing protein [Dehalococcoidia bacterium]|nr:flippase-like domain-containing protein [Dehalococcoidia bacterium]
MLRQVWLYGRILIGVALGVGVAFIIVREVQWTELLNQLAAFNWFLMIPVMGVVVASNTVRALRWRMLFHGRAPTATLLFFVENTGQGLNNLSPIRVVAEPIQFGYIALREGYERGAVLASIVLGRVSDLAITLGSLALGFAIFAPEGAGYLSVIILVLVGILVSVAVLSLFTHRITWFERFPVVRTYSAAWQELIAQPGKLASVMGVTLATWMTLGLAAYLVALSKGLEPNNSQNPVEIYVIIYVVVLGTMTLGAVLPGLPSAIGPFEAAAVAFLGFYGVDKEVALAFGLIIHAAFFIPPIIIALGTLIMFGPPWSTTHRVRRLRRERREARRSSAARRVAQEGDL